MSILLKRWVRNWFFSGWRRCLNFTLYGCLKIRFLDLNRMYHLPCIHVMIGDTFPLDIMMENWRCDLCLDEFILLLYNNFIEAWEIQEIYNFIHNGALGFSCEINSVDFHSNGRLYLFMLLRVYLMCLEALPLKMLRLEI